MPWMQWIRGIHTFFFVVNAGKKYWFIPNHLLFVVVDAMHLLYRGRWHCTAAEAATNAHFASQRLTARSYSRYDDESSFFSR